MKLLPVVLGAVAGLLSFNALADTAYRPVAFCSQFYSDASKIECLKLANGSSYFEEPAVNFCSAFYSEANKLTCLQKVGDGTFDKASLDSCGTLFSEDSKLSCLDSIKKPHKSDDVCSNPQVVKGEVAQAITEIEAYDVQTALHRLQGLSDKLDACAH